MGARLDCSQNPGCSEAGREPDARGDPLNNKHSDAALTSAAAAVANAGPPPAFMPFARSIAAVCMAVGGMALVGWWLSKPLFNSVAPGLGTLKPNTALCLILSGLALAGLPAESRGDGLINRTLSRLQPIAALLLLLIVSMTLLSYLLNMTTGIDKLLVPEGAPNSLRVFPWRMSPISALSFSLLAIAMLPWPSRLARWWRALELLVLVTGIAAFIMLLGYAYRASSLYSLPGFSVVALHTALGLLLLTAGVLTVHPRFLLAGQIMALDQAGAEMRRLLPAAILLPCVVGWLLLQGQRRGWYAPEMGLASFTAANIVIFSSLIWWNSRAVRRSDQALRAHLRRVEAVAEMDRAILGMRSTREIAEKALDHLRGTIPCAYASLVVFEQNSSPRRLVAAGAYADTQALPCAHSIASYEQALREAGSGSTIVLGDLNAIASDSEVFAALRKAGAVSYAGLPLRGEQHLLGMLELIDSRPERFSHDHMQAAHSIADQLAIALQQALLRENLDRHTASLERRVEERTRELQVMNQELTFANRDLEEFTASAAHDLRAPLNAMAGHCGMLRDLIRELPDEEARHRMERIDASVRRMNDVIDGMLGLAQLAKIELVRRPVDVNAVAAEVIQELQQQYPNHRMHCHIDGGSPLFADPRLIRSLLMNLLGNAWKYTRHTERPSVELTRIDDDAGPGFVVRDNGVGFDMNFAQHLFEPFRRMHTLAEFPGVGIGLATSARIVQRYGGRIWAESAVGKGAAFYVTLPEAAASAADNLAAVGA